MYENLKLLFLFCIPCYESILIKVCFLLLHEMKKATLYFHDLSDMSELKLCLLGHFMKHKPIISVE